MSDLLNTFRQKAEDLKASINRAGGIRATIEGLRRQMAIADRKRAIARIRSELKHLDAQIAEMITAVGVQAVGLHKAGKLAAVELQPLCQHIIELEAAIAEQRAELTRLEALATEAEASAPSLTPASAAPSASERSCAHCGKPLPPEATFCPYCGRAAAAPAKAEEDRYCVYCGAPLRPQARFCARCGHEIIR